MGQDLKSIFFSTFWCTFKTITVFKAPIFTYKAILDKAGIFLKNPAKNQDISGEEDAVIEELIMGKDRETVKIVSEDFSKHTLKKLNEMLDEAVAKEDYEKAAALRDEISKRA